MKKQDKKILINFYNYMFINSFLGDSRYNKDYGIKGTILTNKKTLETISSRHSEYTGDSSSLFDIRKVSWAPGEKPLLVDTDERLSDGEILLRLDGSFISKYQIKAKEKK